MRKSIIYLLAVVMLAVACKKEDVFNENGITSIYMPQASIGNGGFNNVYPVPFNNGNVENYTLDTITKTLKIVLGVKNSGLSKDGFSVSVTADKEATDAFLKSKEGNGAVALPEGSYSLPTNVTVESGSNEKTFYLTVDTGKIITDHPDYFEKKMALAVKITGNAVINPKLATTLVLIDGMKVLTKPVYPSPELKADGWKVLPQEINRGLTASATVKIIDAKTIHYTNGTTSDKYNHVIYQAVKVYAGETYTYDMMLYVKGKAWGWIEAYISEKEPVKGEDFKDGKVYEVNQNYAPETKGLMSSLSKITDKREFTTSTTGTLYFVIKLGSWDNNLEDVTLSDITFKKGKAAPIVPPAPPTPPAKAELKPDAWKVLPQEINGSLTASATIEITDGKIHYTNGTTSDYYNHVIYQPVQVQEGKTYVYDMMLHIKGKAWGWIETYISQYEPVKGQDFKDNQVYAINKDYSPETKGLMSALSTVTDKKEFTATKTGTIYFVIKLGSWQNNLEDVTISDLYFREKK